MITDAGAADFKPYVYRGTGVDTLTPGLAGFSIPRSPGHGRRAKGAPRGRRPADPGSRCPECGYVTSGRRHKTECG
jgi:hypothetical protein